MGVGGYLLGGGVNWLGSYNKYGYGAEHVIAMRVVLATGEIGVVDSVATRIEYPIERKVRLCVEIKLGFIRAYLSSWRLVLQYLGTR